MQGLDVLYAVVTSNVTRRIDTMNNTWVPHVKNVRIYSNQANHWYDRVIQVAPNELFKNMDQVDIKDNFQDSTESQHMIQLLRQRGRKLFCTEIERDLQTAKHEIKVLKGDVSALIFEER